ncbi:MAG: transketolase [Dehalococcoidia bacterium]|nr:MAG: transketolase [Dehalococcoidia bacterium]
MTATVPNLELRRRIVNLVREGRDGHIPSAFSIVDILAVLYRGVLRVDPTRPDWDERDYFVLSKGHGCVALYAVLHERGFLSDEDLAGFCRQGGILGEHPDYTKVPGVEASTGSLGHGFPYATGIALGLRMDGRPNRVFSLVGDGECHEGTVWEAANLAANLQLGNLCVFVDWNRSGAQLLPIDDLPARWAAFGWTVQEVDGHDEAAIGAAIERVEFAPRGRPHVIVAHTVKGRGGGITEGHGKWHHRIPDDDEYAQIMGALA